MKKKTNDDVISKQYIALLGIAGLLMSSPTLQAGEEIFEPKPLVKTEVQASNVKSIKELTDGWFIDFSKAAFGTVRFKATAKDDQQVVTVHLGEVLSDGQSRIERKPGGYRRYRAMKQPLKKGTHWYEVKIRPDRRNTKTSMGAILMPDEIGEVMPFRYCELENYPGELKPEDILQIRVHYPFNEEAALFASSNERLNDIWELCKYSIQATSFAGVYVDGDRERIPYEGDAYINQLAHYCLDTEYAMARRTLEYFWDHATWPVEWHQHMIPMVWQEYLYTGDLSFARKYYDKLKAKLLQPLAREDGLLVVPNEDFPEGFLKSIGMEKNIRTLVDWPKGERDNHQIRSVDSVVNAYYYENLRLMAKLDRALGKTGDADTFERQARQVYTAYQNVFFNEKTGLYNDGEGSQHSSLHANFFPLNFGLVPEDKRAEVIKFIKSKGMACSVYGSQHLLDGLYKNGAEDYALSLLTSDKKRSWANMIRVGSTITLEAWDNQFKPNQDWNHAWGAAPANLIPRRLMGITPVEPGFKKVRIQPQIGNLEFAKMRHPSLMGHIDLDIQRHGDRLQYNISIPAGMSAEIIIPGDSQVKHFPAKTTRQNISL